MQKAFEKIKERLEEIYERNDKTKKEAYEEQDWEKFDLFTQRNEGIYSAMSIVNQVAEEYKHVTTCYLGSPCEYQNEDINVEGANEELMKNLIEAKKNCGEDSACWECIFGQREDACYLSELQISGGDDGWIPCSERLPEETDEDLAGDYLDHLDELIEQGVFKPYLVTIEGAKVPTELYYVGSCGEVLWYDEITEEFYKVIAWQELPSVYQPKGE